MLMNAIATRSGLITKRQRLAGTPKSVTELSDGAKIIGDLAKVIYRPRPPAFRHCDRDPLLVNIQANKSWVFREARLLCMRLGAG